MVSSERLLSVGGSPFFLVTASGVTLMGVGSAFWGLVAGDVCFSVLSLARRT